jgi:hypothetical protein
MDNISCKIMSTNGKLTHWENVLKKSFKQISSEKFWILNVTKLKQHNIEINTTKYGMRKEFSNEM